MPLFKKFKKFEILNHIFSQTSFRLYIITSRKFPTDVLSPEKPNISNAQSAIRTNPRPIKPHIMLRFSRSLSILS